MKALKAGLAYFLLVFAAGFALGTIRVLFLVPAVGETLAVLIETPVILTVSWYACAFVVAKLRVPPVTGDRIAMGMIAFALLMIAEAGVAWLLGGRSVSTYLAHYASPAGALGLAGQIVFGAFPVLQLGFSRKPRR
ncbi:MAG: hypothetical protein Kow0026_07490 [Oricola sp.]